MPVEKYYGGHGKEVMRDMKARHGDRAEEVFYATANKKGMNQGGGSKKKLRGFRGLLGGQGKY